MTVNDLAARFNVTTATIRRDLIKLEDLKLVERYHGGVKSNDSQSPIKVLNIRKQINAKDKRDIAKYAASFIENNQTVFIGGGSTSSYMPRYITAKNLVVVTNNVQIAAGISSSGHKCYILPGFFDYLNNNITGNDCLDILNNMYFDSCFLGASGINKNGGFYTTGELSASIKHMVIKRSAASYILADKSKYSNLSFTKFASFNEAMLISNAKPDEPIRDLKVFIVPEKNKL